MACNLNSYLEEQELQCRRIARSCNEGTYGHAEWIKTAESLLQRRKDHAGTCSKCKQPSEITVATR